jgi:hypothetical protein
MAAKKKLKRGKKPARAAGRTPTKATKAKARPAGKGTPTGKRAPPRKVARPKAKRPAERPVVRLAAPSAAPAAVTAATLSLLQAEPLRAEATSALRAGEQAALVVGRTEDGLRVETLVFAPSGKGLQSTGSYVHRGDWNGARLLTDRGHLLDADANCFCRDCEAAKGYTLDDDE